jgi:hypothetical protein
MDQRKRTVPRLVATGAIVAGLAVGSYGIASAASGSGTSSSATTTTTTPSATAPIAPPPGGAGGHGGWGGQRSDETLLTGDTLAKVTAAAKAKVRDGTIVRVETDADGHAAYEAHMTAADGSPLTVYVGEDFAVTSVETR